MLIYVFVRFIAWEFIMEVGEKIRKLRKTAGLSQVELAGMLGVSKQSLYKYETGVVRNIPFEKIEKLAQILHTTPQYLLGWDEPSDALENGRTESRRLEKYFMTMFESLDDLDKGRLIGSAETMLKQSKYAGDETLLKQSEYINKDNNS